MLVWKVIIQMSVKRIKINAVEEKMLEEIKKAEGINNEHIFNKMIRMYYENAYSTKSENNILDELKEYILLLVKSNMSLPTHPEEMQHLIKSQSRFEKPVLEKINEKKLSSK